MAAGISLQVSFYAGLRQAAGQKTADFSFPDPISVKKLVQEIILAYPQLDGELTGIQGELLRHNNYLVNGRDVRYLEGKFDRVLEDDDQVSIFPAVGGGQIGIIWPLMQLILLIINYYPLNEG